MDFLTYHELAHASHYALVGNAWWGNLIQAELEHIGVDLVSFSFPLDPYRADGNDRLDGYIAVAESWAEYISEEFGAGNPEFLFLRNTYIPEGIYHDLIDNVDSFEVDNIQGYNIPALFQALTHSTIEEMRDDLRQNLPAGNTVPDFNELFLRYGY